MTDPMDRPDPAEQKGTTPRDLMDTLMGVYEKSNDTAIESIRKHAAELAPNRLLLMLLDADVQTRAYVEMQGAATYLEEVQTAANKKIRAHVGGALTMAEMLREAAAAAAKQEG